SHVQSKIPGRLALVLVNVGLIGLAVDSLWFGRRLLPLWACLLAGSYLAYGVQMRQTFKDRQRAIDPALAYTILALIGGAAWVVVGLCLAFGALQGGLMENRLAYVYLALVG